jgi:hypothetical protein
MKESFLMIGKKLVDAEDIPDENVGAVNQVRDFGFIAGANHINHHKKQSQKILNRSWVNDYGDNTRPKKFVKNDQPVMRQ